MSKPTANVRIVATVVSLKNGTLGDLIAALQEIAEKNEYPYDAQIETAFSWPMNVALVGACEGVPASIYFYGNEETLTAGEPLPALNLAEEPAATALGIVPQVSKAVSAEPLAAGDEHDPAKFDPDDEATIDRLLDRRFPDQGEGLGASEAVEDLTPTAEQIAEAEREAIERQREEDEAQFDATAGHELSIDAERSR